MGAQRFRKRANGDTANGTLKRIKQIVGDVAAPCIANTSKGFDGSESAKAVGHADARGDEPRGGRRPQIR